jgi:hypothetical protein
MHGNQEEHSGAPKNSMEALAVLYELTFSVWGPTDLIIYSWM